MYGLDLFSGIGGITQALAPWVTPVAYCENDPAAQRVLLRRMASGELPAAPIWDDVRTLTRCDIPVGVNVQVLQCGFPCQDLSTAGRGAGLAGARSGLFFEIIRLAREFEPTFIFLENVPAIRTRGLDVVLQELAALGFDARWTTVSADFVGAPHRRERWFLLAAHPDRLRVWQRRTWSESNQTEASAQLGDHGTPQPVANTHADRCDGQGLSDPAKIGQACGDSPSTGQEVPNTDLHGQRQQTKGRKKESPPRFGEDYWRSEAGPFGSAWFSPQPALGGGTDGLSDGMGGGGPMGGYVYPWEEGIARTCEPFPGRVDQIKQLGNAVVPSQVRTAFQYLMGF